MIRRSLLEHARRQWRTTHRLISRHRVITHTDMGKQLLRGLEVRSRYTRAVPRPAARVIPGVPMGDVDWSADEQDEGMTVTRQEFVQPTVQNPDDIPLASEFTPELPGLPEPDVSMPRVDPLVELVRRVREQTSGEPVTPSAPTVPRSAVDPLIEAVRRARGQTLAEPVEAPEPLAIQPAVDPLVEAVRRVRGQTTQPELNPVPLAGAPQPASVTPSEPVSTSLLPTADDTRAARLSALRRRQPLGTRIVELPTSEQAGDAVQPSRPAATPSAPEKAPVPPTATPGIAEQERVPATVLSLATPVEEAAHKLQLTPHEEAISNTLPIEPDVLDEHGTSEPHLIDETTNTSADDEMRTPEMPHSAPPDWVERLAKAARDQTVKPSTPFVDVETSSPALVSSEMPVVTAPPSTAPSSKVAVPPAQGDARTSALASVPGSSMPPMRVPADSSGTMNTERVDTAVSPSSQTVPSPAPTLPHPVVVPEQTVSSTASPETVPSPAPTLPHPVVVPEQTVSPTPRLSTAPSHVPASPRPVVPEFGASPTASLPVQVVADSAHVQLATSEDTQSDQVATSVSSVDSVDGPVVHAEGATVDVGAHETAIKAPADALLEIPVVNSTPSTPGAADQVPAPDGEMPTSTDYSAQRWAARLAQAAGLPEPIAKPPLDHTSLPFVPPATLAASNTFGAQAKPMLSTAQPVPATSSFTKDVAATSTVSPSSVPDRSPEAWAKRMAALMHPPSAPSPSTQQMVPPFPAVLQSREATSSQPRVVQPVEAMHSAQARGSAVHAASPAQVQRPSVNTSRVPENTPAASANVAPSPPAPDDRSPAAWAARLFPTVQPSEQQSMLQLPNSGLRSPVDAAPEPESLPTPLTETTRRFLQPLVGIDPGSVRVHTGPLAHDVASSHRADAVTTGEDVLLASGNAGDSPEALGLLAHELTHVARTREPRFVPPVLVKAGSTHHDEEALAQAVEQRVTRVARVQQVRPRGINPTGVPFDTARPSADASRPQAEPNLAQAQMQGDDGGAWDGLPAPWEPLPTWLVAPTPVAAPVSSRATVGEAIASPLASAGVGSAASSGTQAAAPAVQLAAINRTDATEAPSATPPASQEPPKQAAEPNLDVLARQVYSILKQRLAAERRRQG